jgi:GPH family glycoside/pentoside/hexuronide:cation symporter
MSESRLKTFNYAVGMFGTSIPINMLKTFAAIYYVDGLGLTTLQFARILFWYAFVDAADNLVYGFLSDRTRTRWGRRRPWLFISAPLLAVGLVLFYGTPGGLAGTPLFVWAMLFYIFTGTIDSLVNANYGALFPELFLLLAGLRLVAMITASPHPMVTKARKWPASSYGILGAVVILYMAVTSREVPVRAEERSLGSGTASRACSRIGSSGWRVSPTRSTARPCRWCSPR